MLGERTTDRMYELSKNPVVTVLLDNVKVNNVCNVKVNSMLTSQKAHLRPALISSFLSMKQLGVFLLPPWMGC